jgi:predicted DNA-binding protein (UPF0251 family)
MSPRPKRLRKIMNPPLMKGFKPFGLQHETAASEPVFLLFEEYEALRLVDFELKNHEQAAGIMMVSRPTLTRIYAEARRKIAEALINARPFIIEGGKIFYDSEWFHCPKCNCDFNNPFVDKSTPACALCGSHKVVNRQQVIQTNGEQKQSGEYENSHNINR